jgi:hypothetical protein
VIHTVHVPSRQSRLCLGNMCPFNNHVSEYANELMCVGGALIAVWPLTCVGFIVVLAIMAEVRFCDLHKCCARHWSDVPGFAYACLLVPVNIWHSLCKLLAFWTRSRLQPRRSASLLIEVNHGTTSLLITTTMHRLTNQEYMVSEYSDLIRGELVYASLSIAHTYLLRNKV